MTRHLARCILLWLLLAPALAQAQTPVGVWTSGPFFTFTFDSAGRWRQTVQIPGDTSCGGAASYGGPYTSTSSALALDFDFVTCSGQTTTLPTAISFATGAYTRTGSCLILRLSFTSIAQSINDWALDPQGGTCVIAANTPLPSSPPPQTAFLASDGQLSSGTVSTSTSGTFGSATIIVSVNLLQGLQQLPPTGFAATNYNVYVAALVPGRSLGTAAPAWYAKGRVSGWGPLGSPIAAYLENVSDTAASQATVQILSNTDITSLAGTEVYVGYGTSDAEMLANRRYRGVFKVQ